MLTTQDLREMTDEQLNNEVVLQRKDYTKSCLQAKSGELKTVHQIRNYKKTRSRALSILRERQLGISDAPQKTSQRVIDKIATEQKLAKEKAAATAKAQAQEEALAKQALAKEQAATTPTQTITKPNKPSKSEKSSVDLASSKELDTTTPHTAHKPQGGKIIRAHDQGHHAQQGKPKRGFLKNLFAKKHRDIHRKSNP